MSVYNKKVIPLGSRIVVEPVTEEKTQSGIYIQASKENFILGKVIAVGEPEKDEKMPAINSVIAFQEYAGLKIGKFIVLKTKDAIALIE